MASLFCAALKNIRIERGLGAVGMPFERLLTSEVIDLARMAPYSRNRFITHARIPMTTYAIGHLHEVELCADIVEYLEKIDATLAPHGGRFILHGGPVERLEGHFCGDLIVIEFDSREQAHAWYCSPAYQAILPLRTRHARGDVFIVDQVAQPHRAAEVLKRAA
ncbi:DUF1330 domain-containing protein [Paraburkholderia bannensis]|uniref:DUF1330 domain-containing protein n=1 Tax=Paraburkholderia bannensis TaxID=765414 RepID=UPI0038B7944F